MKSLKYILAISLALFVGKQSTIACGPFYPVSPSSLCIFRSCSPELERQWHEGSRFQAYEKAENCLLWQKITSPSIPLKDIESVVYDVRLKDMKDLTQGVLAGNKFAEWLANPAHREDLDYLLTAKEIEALRNYMNDPWYYAYEGDDEHIRLDSLQIRCKEYCGNRHAARYTLQLTRLYFAKKDYASCCNLWESCVSSMPQDIVTDMIASYVGGAYSRGGNRQKAIELFSRGQDIGSLISLNAWEYTLDVSSYTDHRVKELEYIFTRFPNSPLLSVKLQKYIHNHEQSVFSYADWESRGFPDPIPAAVDQMWVNGSLVAITDTVFCNELKSFANMAIASPDCNQKGMWNYALAYLYYLDNDFSKALSYLIQAERSDATPVIKESIRAFRFLLEAHYAHNTKGYKKKLLRELKWLDDCMARDPELAEIRIGNDWLYYNQQYDNKMNYSFYYWQDVARRVLLSEVCPRIKNEGDPVLALQLANYATNRIIQLAPTDCDDDDDDDDDSEDEESYTSDISMTEFRNNEPQGNYYDYSNQFFGLINSSSADVAARYARHISCPTSELEKFLNEKSYVDNDYICDIVGTLYLREMNYKEATEWLAKVSQTYQQRTNIAKAGYFRLDPFRYQVDKKRFIADSTDYKLRFAQEMLCLENMMQSDAEPNRKADAKIRFAIGLRNSFEFCWYLTDYVYLRDYTGQNVYAQRAYQRVDTLTEEALSEYTNPEHAAKVLFEMMNFKTIMENYPSTHMAAYVRSRCDNYYDYSLLKR